MIKFLKSKKFKVSFFEGSTYFFVSTLPLFLSINTIAIWVFLASSFFVLGLKERKEILWKRRAFIIPFILLFFLYILGLWLSTNTDIALKNISRVWVHTCSLDHENALNNYIARGMKIFKTEIIRV